MAGQFVLSNRLQRMQEALGRFGNTVEETRQLRLQNERQAQADKMAQETHGRQMQESDLRLKGLQLQSEKANQIKDYENQLSQLETGTFMGPVQEGDWNGVMADSWAPMKDRIRAAWSRAHGENVTADELKQVREDNAMARLELGNKSKREQEAHESQLATEKANREKGSYTSPGTTTDGNFAILNTRTGKLGDSGVGKDTSQARGRDGLTEQERRDKAVFTAKDKLRDVYEKTGTANAIVMLNDIASKIGGVEGKGNIPGIGAQNITPQFFLTQEGKDVKTSLAGLRNIVLKDRSGAAVSNQEFDRLKEEIGGGVFTTDTDLRSKLKRMGEIVAQHAKSIDATFQGDPEVPRQAFEEYQKAGGTLGSSLRLSGNRATQAPKMSAIQSRAQEALNDPEATEEDKAAARKILGL